MQTKFKRQSGMLKAFAVAGAVILGVGTYAHSAAAVVTLVLESPGSNIYQQTENSPCVIGDPSCTNPDGFPLTVFPAGGGSQDYDEYSPEYTVSQITDLLDNTSFIIGVDVNSTKKPIATERLKLFEVLVDGVLEFVYSWHGPGMPLMIPNNGNGYSDVLLTLVDLSGFAGELSVQFHAIVNTATNGREEFFLIAADAPPCVPTEDNSCRGEISVSEPAPLAVFGFGLLVLGYIRRPARHRAGNIPHRVQHP